MKKLLLILFPFLCFGQIINEDFAPAIDWNQTGLKFYVDPGASYNTTVFEQAENNNGTMQASMEGNQVWGKRYFDYAGAAYRVNFGDTLVDSLSNNAYIMSLWLRVPNSANYECCISRGRFDGDFEIRKSNSNYMQFYTSITSKTTGSTIANDQWVMYTYVRDVTNSMVYIYFDTTLTFSGAHNQATVTGGGDLVLGVRSTDNTEAWNGDIGICGYYLFTGAPPSGWYNDYVVANWDATKKFYQNNGVSNGFYSKNFTTVKTGENLGATNDTLYIPIPNGSGNWTLTYSDSSGSSATVKAGILNNGFTLLQSNAFSSGKHNRTINFTKTFSGDSLAFVFTNTAYIDDILLTIGTGQDKGFKEHSKFKRFKSLK